MKRIIAAFFLLVILSACGIGKDERKSMPAKNEPKTTHCLGRHSVDLPVYFYPSAVTTGMFQAPGSGVDDPAFEIVVRTAALNHSQFATEVRKRGDELRKKSGIASNVLRAEQTLSDEATLFRVQRIDDAYISEINLLRGGSLVSVSLKSYDNNFAAAEERLRDFATAIKAKDSKASEAEGYCLGSVVVPGTFKGDSGKFHFRDGKGNSLGVDISTVKRGGTPLLSRMSGPNSLLSLFHVGHTVLRTSERNVAGMHAQEWLAWTNLGPNGDEKTFKFALETMPHAPDKRTPSLTLSFDTGQLLEDGTPTKTSLSDEEAMQLWDSIVQSIRLAKS